mmetsp:Transcript_33585/g.62085  ORF Transcript_33585/g.62085 Transcript_33585/m.62085 type:complete len:237 (+) Transcript_33585:68-778(+)
MDPRDLTHSNPDTVPQEHGIVGVAGTKLEQTLRGFQEGCFQEEVDEFVKKHAYEFAVACPDGSCPLGWTTLHEEYKQLFDAQLEYILWTQNLTKEKFVELCATMHQYSEALPEEAALPDIFPDDPHRPGSLGISVAHFRYFMANLTASEDFGRFLQVMFAAVGGTLRATTLLPKPEEEATASPAAPPVHEIEVAVPDGVFPGQVLAVEFLGMRYELVVPEGYGPGTTFKTAVTLPN